MNDNPLREGLPDRLHVFKKGDDAYRCVQPGCGMTLADYQASDPHLACEDRNDSDDESSKS